MKPGTHLTREEIAAGIVSIANICLMVTAAFWPRRAAGQRARKGTDPFWRREASDTVRTWREQMGFIAVGLGLCSQVLFCLVEGGLKEGWVPFNPGMNSITRVEGHYADLGTLVSLATVSVALLGKGLRRYAGIWVGSTTFVFWGMVGLGVALRTLFP